MKPSARAALGLLLALSLDLKLLTVSSAAAPDPETFRLAASAMLDAGGLSVSAERRPFGEVFWGRRGDCRLMLGEDDPHGTLAEAFRRLAVPVGPLRFAWRGRLYEAAPRRRALIRFYLRRELGRFGDWSARQPLIAWAASPQCRGLRLDWNRLSALPR